MASVTYSFSQTAAPTLNSFTSGTQRQPDVLGLKDGGLVSAYNGGGFILLDFFNSSHEAIGGFKIPYNNASNTVAPGQPSLTQLANGNVVVAWYDQGTSDEGIKTSIFSSTGVLINQEINVGPSTSINFNTPTVAALNNGNFVVAAEFSGNIYFNIQNSSGTNVNFYSQVNTVTTGTQNDAQVVGLADGGFAVTWTDTNPADQLIKGRIYNADGTARTAELTVGQFGDNTQSSLVALENGNFAVVYTDSGWGEGGTLGNGLTLQIFTSNGDNVTPGTFVHVNTATAGDEVDPDVTILDNGFIMVTWTHEFTSTDHDIYAAVFDQDGNRILLDGANQRVITSSVDEDIRSTVSGLLNGHAIVGWQDGSSTDIQGSIVEITRTTLGDANSETLKGDGLIDVINGQGGNDILDGGAGADTLRGGADSDTYYVDNVGDIIDESVPGSSGTDTVLSSKVSINLSDVIHFNGAVENAAVTGSLSLNLTGNGLANYLQGNSGANILDGQSGADTMRGGAGNDTYYVDNGGDVIFETGTTNGSDSIFSSVSYGLAAAIDTAVELIVTTSKNGTSAINLTGNNFNQTIGGNAGVNVLNGLGGNDVVNGNGGNDKLFGSFGNDTLIGGAGNDLFFFDTKANATTNHDVISDFSNIAGNNDTIYLENAIYTTLAAGSLGGAFASNTTGLATQADDRIIYESDTGNLFYDVNGSAAGGSILFATLTGHPAITASDFVVY